MNLIKRNEANWLPSVLDEMFKNDRLGGATTVNRIRTNILEVNIQESEESFLFQVAAQGKKPENFNIELDNDLLEISSAEEKENVSGDHRKFTRKEFSFTNFK